MIVLNYVLRHILRHIIRLILGNFHKHPYRPPVIFVSILFNMKNKIPTIKRENILIKSLWIWVYYDVRKKIFAKLKNCVKIISAKKPRVCGYTCIQPRNYFDGSVENVYWFYWSHNWRFKKNQSMILLESYMLYITFQFLGQPHDHPGRPWSLYFVRPTHLISREKMS